MKWYLLILIVCHVNLLFVSLGECATDDRDVNNTQDVSDVPSDIDVDHNKLPTILIVTLFRNKAHILPYFFACLDRIEYPKKRISLW